MNYNRQIFLNRTTNASNDVVMAKGVKGCFPFNNFNSKLFPRNFGWYIKWNGPFRFGPTGIFGTSFEGGVL